MVANEGFYYKFYHFPYSLQLYVDQGFAAYSSIRSQFLSSTVWGPLFVGGIPERLSPLLKGVTDTSFTGCLKELKIQQKLETLF